MDGSVATGIRRIIQEKAFLQNAIARKSVFTVQQFNDMLHDRKVIRADYIPYIAKALEVSVQEIYDAGRRQ